MPFSMHLSTMFWSEAGIIIIKRVRLKVLFLKRVPGRTYVLLTRRMYTFLYKVTWVGEANQVLRKQNHPRGSASDSEQGVEPSSKY